jgi:DNA polymerase/3'-5' exonuclease PolX
MEHLVGLISRVHGLDRVKALPLARNMRRRAALRAELGEAPTYATVRRVLRRDYLEGLPAGARADLTYNFSKRVPREVLAQVETTLARYAPNLTAEEPAFTARSRGWLFGGSYRRGRPYSNDLDIVFLGGPDEWHALVERVNAREEGLRITPPYQGGETREECVFLVAGRRYRIKADVFWTEPSAAAYMLLYATGNYTSNIRMRAVAKRSGRLLNQYGLFQLVPSSLASRSEGRAAGAPAASEREIFRLLGMDWLAPGEREL